MKNWALGVTTRLVFGAAMLVVATASAETRREESVGVAPVVADGAAARSAAMADAVQGAVVRTAWTLLPEGFVPPVQELGRDGMPLEPDAWLASRLGEDPSVYVTRFRIVEDRGRRRAMFADDDVEEEYVVLADVTVDVDSVGERLTELGLLRAGASGSGRRVTLVVEGLSSWQPLALLREALEAERGVSRVVPLEFTRGRAVFEVLADRDAPALVESLKREAPEGLQIVVVDQQARDATLLIDWRPPAVEPDPPG